MSTPCRSASARASERRAHVKPMIRASGGRSEHHVALVEPPTPDWITLTRTSEWWIFCSSLTAGLDRADDVALKDQVEVTDLSCAQLAEQGLERGAAARALRHLLGAQTQAALLGKRGGPGARWRRRGRARRRRVASRGRESPPDRQGGFLDANTGGVYRASDLAPGIAGDHRSPTRSVPRRHEQRGDRAATGRRGETR